jgi:hypothetical protein
VTRLTGALVVSSPVVQPANPHGFYATDLVARFLTGERRRFIRLVEVLEYERANGVQHETPVGFECDGGSIPRAAWWLVGHPLDGSYVRSCVTHDMLCHLARQGLEVEVLPGEWKPATRAHADSVFLESLRCESLPEWKARLMYSAVRAGALWKK